MDHQTDRQTEKFYVHYVYMGLAQACPITHNRLFILTYFCKNLRPQKLISKQGVANFNTIEATQNYKIATSALW